MSSWRSAASHAAQRRDGHGQHHHPYRGAEADINRAASNGGYEKDGAGVLDFQSRGPRLPFAAPHPWAHQAGHIEQPHAPHPWAHQAGHIEQSHAPALPPDPFFPWNMPEGITGDEVSFGRTVTCGGGMPNVLSAGAAHPHGGCSVVAVAGSDRDGKASCLPLAREVGCREAVGKGRNFIISPLSFHAALALLAAGTGGETQRELLGFLGSASLGELHRAAATELVGRLRSLPQTSFACGVWVDRNWELRPEFMSAAASRYAAVAESVNFLSEAEMARQRVNAFVTDATNGLIRDVLPSGSVDSSTVVVLANALYFKGTWALPFDRSATFAAPFHLPDGTIVRAPFMTMRTSQQHIAVFSGFKALKLHYKNDGADGHIAAFYMLLLLPDSTTLKLTHLYDKAVSTPDFIKEHTPAAKVPVGRFMVPKFKFTFEFEASPDMQKLGVARAFRGGDFSGMVTGGNGLSIMGVYHKATIEVDELGTVAAAATAVAIQQCGSARPPVDFVADRPFLFAIVDEKTGAVLFLGHVVNPLAE